MKNKSKFFNHRYRNYFFNPMYWWRGVKNPKRAYQNLIAAIRYPNLYHISRSVEGLISLYLGVYLYKAVLKSKSKSHNVVEVGAFKGLSTIYLSLAAEKAKKKVKSFEIFTGLPTADSDVDTHFSEGQYSSEIMNYVANVKEYLMMHLRRPPYILIPTT